MPIAMARCRSSTERERVLNMAGVNTTRAEALSRHTRTTWSIHESPSPRDLSHPGFGRQVPGVG